MSFYKRNLPHYQPIGYAYFITSRLVGTIPYSIYKKLKKDYEKRLKEIAELKSKTKKWNEYQELHKNYFLKTENILDSGSHGKLWLRNKQIATILANTFHFYDNKRYDLICYTIMPNHFHLVLFPKLERYKEFLAKHIANNNTEETFYYISKIMQDIKKYSAKESNKILHRSGKFWQNESYDHVIRNKEELLNIVNYVLDNPVKAGLCKTRDDWEWNYFNPKYLI